MTYTTLSRVRAYLGTAYSSAPADAVVEARITDASAVMDTLVLLGGAGLPSATTDELTALATKYAALMVLESSGGMDDARQDRLAAEVDDLKIGLRRHPGAFGLTLRDRTMTYADDPADPEESEFELP